MWKSLGWLMIPFALLYVALIVWVITSTMRQFDLAFVKQFTKEQLQAIHSILVVTWVISAWFGTNK